MNLLNILLGGIVGAVVGAIIGAGWAAHLYTREARRQLRIDSLRRFVANRSNVTGPEFTQALNDVLVVFGDKPEVIGVLEAFRRDRTNEKLTALYRAMGDAAGIPHSAVSDDLFLTPFNTKPESSQVGRLPRGP